ncbi:hypothetical protein V8E55_001886 [Tylopilus felleus]
MRVFASVLLAVSSVFAYQVTSPGESQGWTTTGPNTLTWQRVDTDPLNFTTVLINQNMDYSEVMDSVVDGTLGSFQCSAPNGGWPSGSGFVVNLARDPQDLNSLLAQSNQFNITGVSSTTSPSASSTTSPSASSGATTSASAQTGSSAATTTSSETSTTPTGANAASLGVDAPGGLLAVVVALTALITNLV